MNMPTEIRISDNRVKNTFAYLTIECASEEARTLLEDVNRNVVYFFYSADDKLLYIGRSNNFSSRWKQHLQSDKDMMQVSKVCLHLFETKPETIFYEAQQIASLKPVWNKAGIDAPVAKNMIDPLDIVWLDCRLKANTEETETILSKMELIHCENWYLRHNEDELVQEFYRIHRLQQWESVPHPYERKENVNPFPEDGVTYKIIKKKTKTQKSHRMTHIWQGNDTLCGAVSRYKLKTENYWFSVVKKLPNDACGFCKQRLNSY